MKDNEISYIDLLAATHIDEKKGDRKTEMAM